jgi:hypothetical protein
MKKLLLVFTFVSFFSNAKGQDIADILTEEVCSCAAGNNEKNQDAQSRNMEMELGICIITSVSNHKEAVKAKYGDVLQDEDAMGKLGTDIGLKMASVCPDIFMALAEMSDDDEAPAVEEVYSTIEGRIVEVKTEQFLTVVVKDNSGRTHTLLVLTFFEGSDLLIEDKLKKNDKVSIDYLEQEFYDAKAKDFRYYKVIQGIKKI